MGRRRNNNQLEILRVATAALDGRYATELPLGEGREPPLEFCIFAFGSNKTDKGTFVFDADSATSVMGIYRNRSVPLMMDYEHQSLAQPPIEAPACATEWTPEIRNGALWATNIKWTDRAAAMLRAGEYRLFSPAFRFDEKSMRITQMLNIALTNNPAMHGIAPLVAATATTGASAMDYEKLYLALKAEHEKMTAELAALKAKIDHKEPDEDDAMSATIGLSFGAPRAERLTAVGDLVAIKRELLALTGQPKAALALATLSTWKDSHGEVQALKAKVEADQAVALRASFDSILGEAVKAGKLPPAKRESIEKLALKLGGGKPSADGVDFLTGYCADLAVVARGEAVQQLSTGGDVLTDLQRHILRTTGTKPDAMRKFMVDQARRNDDL